MSFRWPVRGKKEAPLWWKDNVITRFVGDLLDAVAVVDVDVDIEDTEWTFNSSRIASTISFV